MEIESKKKLALNNWACSWGRVFCSSVAVWDNGSGSTFYWIIIVYPQLLCGEQNRNLTQIQMGPINTLGDISL